MSLETTHSTFARTRPARTAHRIDFAWLELTNGCNLECVHCYAGSGPKAFSDDRLTTEDYRNALGDLASLGCRKIQFIGGEATLHKDIVALIHHARTLKFEFIEVFTNLTFLPQPMLDAFVDLEVSLATSFYSSDPDTHDRITQRRGSWERTVHNLERVLASGLTLRVGIILMDENRADLESTEDFLRALGVHDIGRDTVRAIGRARAKTDPGNTPACDMRELCGSCAGGVICIGYDGRVSPCIMSKAWSVGTLLERSLPDLASDPALARTRDHIYAATEDGRTTEVHAGGCNPDCTPCSPKSNDTCAPKLTCYPQHSPSCTPKY